MVPAALSSLPLFMDKRTDMFNCNTCCCGCECHEQLTTVYSSASIAALESLMSCVLDLFDCEGRRLDEVIRYGVFCREDTYANFTGWDYAPDWMDVPEILTAECSRPCERVRYVRTVIEQVLNGEIEKPQWMEHVEMEDACEGVPPSTFLYIVPVSEEYECLARTLRQFLYSPNMMTTMIECD